MKTKISSTDSPVTKALILICEKCGKNMGYSDDDNLARSLQKNLKERIKSDGRKKEVRAVVTGCIDICPKNEIAICLSRTNQPNDFFTTSGEVDAMAEELYKKI